MKGVVDFVGNTGGETADGDHFFGANDLGLFLFELARAALDALF